MGGLAFSRIWYEWAFPEAAWAGGIGGALLCGGIAGILGGVIQRRLAKRSAEWGEMGIIFFPMWLNVIWLFTPQVDLIRSRLLFFGAIWLAVALYGYFCDLFWWRKWRGRLAWLIAGIVPIYWLTMPRFVGQADSFEFQVVTPKLGIVHPTGYPLYLLLGKLFTALSPDFGSFAWQLNVVTMGYALAALCLIYGLAYCVPGDRLATIIPVLALAFAPTFWSQAIEAEVYSLHALIVAGALLTMTKSAEEDHDKWRFFTAFWLGVGLTNHLTTMLLLPAFGLTLFTHRDTLRKKNGAFWLKLGLLFVAPLALYAYLPWRWAAVNGEPMGGARFLAWVTGGRFAGALQWGAWLRDPTRYQVVGRLLVAEWGWLGLTWGLVGWLGIWRRSRRMGLILLVSWLAFVFYCLNYYVPDLAVFLLPAQLIIAVCLAGLPAVAGDLWARFTPRAQHRKTLTTVVTAGMGAFFLTRAATVWGAVDQSQEDGQTAWGRAVLALPLDVGAAILADGEKFAPLFYLQQAEGVRPDLEIMVLPDEAAYRAELDGRVGAGQTIYLARFLPGLEAVYHLRSMAPLLEVSREPLVALPANVEPRQLDFAGIQLVGAAVEPISPFDQKQTAVTLFWQVDEPPEENVVLYLRWRNWYDPPQSGHAANNYYPVAAWQPGEIIADFHQLPRPPVQDRRVNDRRMEIEAAWGAPFADPADLAWQTVVELPPFDHFPPWQAETPTRIMAGLGAVAGATFPQTVRAGEPFFVYWFDQNGMFQWDYNQVNLQEGERYEVRVEGARLCGWLRVASECVVGEIEARGAALPAGAWNFADQIALTDIELPNEGLTSGGRLAVTLSWQALREMEKDYTVFVQLLDENDSIVGQVDAYPLQGSFPTTQWRAGEVVRDPYHIQLPQPLPPGNYHLYIGLYTLETFARLPILDEFGSPIDDKAAVWGLPAN